VETLPKGCDVPQLRLQAAFDLLCENWAERSLYIHTVNYEFRHHNRRRAQRLALRGRFKLPYLAQGFSGSAEATKSAQRAGIDHKRQALPTAYLGRKPSYDRATFDRIRLALGSANPPSLSDIAKAERLSKQTVFRLKQDPLAALAALDAWGL
jgi:hypothetical protein